MDVVTASLVVGLVLIVVLLLWILVAVRRRPHGPPSDAAAISAHLSQTMQPWLLDFGQRLATLQILPSMKESADQKLPTLQKTAEDLGQLISNAHQVRLEEEKVVRESLTRLAEFTRHTPEVSKQLGVLQTELKRLQGVEQGVRELTNLFLSAQGRGQMGEEAVRNVFQNFPDEMWQEQFVINGSRVDFAVFMPNRRLLPIDSKTSGLQSILDYYALGERIATAADEAEKASLLRDQGKLQTKVRSAVLNKATEVAGYIQPEHGTLGLALQAVPDSLFPILDVRTRKSAAEQNVQIVPYGLLLPIVNILRGQNQYDRLDLNAVIDAMHGIRLQAHTIRDVLTNRFDKAQKYIQSGIEDVQTALAAIERNSESVEDGTPAADEAPRAREHKARAQLRQAALEQP